MDAIIHVFHERAEYLAERARAAGVPSEIVALSDPADFRARIGEVEILVTERPPADAWTRAARLRWIQALGAGVDGILPAPGLPERVAITSVRGVFAPEAAEHALALMLALQRNLPAHVASQSQRRYRPFASGTLAGRTAGVVGLGEIGRRIAAACAGLGMRVLGCCRRPRPVPCTAEVYAPDRLGDLLCASDWLFVALPLTPATRGLIGREALLSMPRGAHLIHIGRGGVVDEAALLDALCEGHLAGAALDVFEQEPLPPQSPLWDAPNTIVTPHVAGYGLRYIERVSAVLMENLARLSRGAELLHAVDRESGY